MSREVDGKGQKGKKEDQATDPETYNQSLPTNSRDVVLWYFHLFIYKIGMLIFVSTALLLYG